MDKDTIGGLVNKMGLMLSERQWRLAAAESCTGGWLSKVCTDQAGSSAWFESAVVCYDNRVKRSLLEVPASVLDQHGAVSEATALAMARGVLRRRSCRAAPAPMSSLPLSACGQSFCRGG